MVQKASGIGKATLYMIETRNVERQGQDPAQQRQCRHPGPAFPQRMQAEKERHQFRIAQVQAVRPPSAQVQ